MTRAKIFFYSQFLVLIFLGIAFHFFGVPNFSEKNQLNERVLQNQPEQISFTGSVIFEKNKGEFLVKDEKGKEFLAISKDFYLNNFIGDKKKFFEGEIFFDKDGKKFFDVKKISVIEEKKIEELKKYFFENKLGGYGFLLDENFLKAVKGGSKTFLKNSSGEVILKFFSFDFKNTNLIKGNFFSEGGEEFSILTKNGEIFGELKELKNGREIFLKNKEKKYGVLIQINYGKIGENYLQKEGKTLEEWQEDEKKLAIQKREISKILSGFYFVEKQSIVSQKCGGKDNIVCDEGYFCELFSTDEDASGRCIKINN
ncbi:hypothetical protein LR002_02400 [Candidatus Gracilibacteria bacterium]|nr:hypothetical protein [Candidatus Gracilibacteria bacterium]